MSLKALRKAALALTAVLFVGMLAADGVLAANTVIPIYKDGVKWVCKLCGKRTTVYGGPSYPNPPQEKWDKCPNGSGEEKRHRWERAVPVNWVCQLCGKKTTMDDQMSSPEQMYSRDKCPKQSGKSKAHEWRRVK